MPSIADPLPLPLYLFLDDLLGPLRPSAATPGNHSDIIGLAPVQIPELLYSRSTRTATARRDLWVVKAPAPFSKKPFVEGSTFRIQAPFSLGGSLVYLRPMIRRPIDSLRSFFFGFSFNNVDKCFTPGPPNAFSKLWTLFVYPFLLPLYEYRVY